MTLTFLDRFRPQRAAQSALVFEGLAQVRAYWEGLRNEGTLPQRSALDPRGLNGMLDRIFLAERIGRGLVQLRVAGSGLSEFAGAEARGLPLSCFFASESRPLLAQCLENVFDGPALAEIDLGSDRQGGDGLVARLLLLPLTEDAGNKLVLGAISFTKEALACKFQIRSRREETLLIKAADKPPVEPELQPVRRYGHLALVHSNE